MTVVNNEVCNKNLENPAVNDNGSSIVASNGGIVQVTKKKSLTSVVSTNG